MYRKFKADQIFNGEELISGKALITAADGTIEALIDQVEAGEAETLEGILCPGFINAHCHLELSHMRGRLPERTGLVDFVFRVVTERNGTDRKFSNEEIMEAVASAEEEMRKGGIVAVGDVCNNTVSLAQKQNRNLQYYNFIEASGWLPGVSGERFARALQLFELFTEAGMQASIVPHAPYSVSRALWESILPYFRHRVVSMHNQETPAEDEFFREGTGDLVRMYRLMNIDNTHHVPINTSSLQSCFASLSAAASVILVHNTFTRQEDLDHIKKFESPASFCLCPNANLYIENALPPVELLRANNCRIVLGTDSLASNHGLSILDEMKTIQRHFQIPLDEILRWSTINAAKALLMQDSLGSIEKGKRPGLVLLRNVENGRLENAAAMRII